MWEKNNESFQTTQTFRAEILVHKHGVQKAEFAHGKFLRKGDISLWFFVSAANKTFWCPTRFHINFPQRNVESLRTNSNWKSCQLLLASCNWIHSHKNRCCESEVHKSPTTVQLWNERWCLLNKNTCLFIKTRQKISSTHVPWHQVILCFTRNLTLMPSSLLTLIAVFEFSWALNCRLEIQLSLFITSLCFPGDSVWTQTRQW